MPDEAATDAKKIREALASFAVDPRGDVDAMSDQEIDAYLSGLGVDLPAGQVAMNRQFADISGAERRERAAAKRQQFISGISTVMDRANRSAQEAREELERRLSLVQGSQPQAAAAFFRNMEGATDEDVEQMLSDLEFLESLPDDEDGDGV